MRHMLRLIALLGILFSIAACSVLTAPQVNAVKEFAKATDSYGQIPGDVIRVYRDVVFSRRALLVGGRLEMSKKDAEDALEQALTERDGATEKAERADKALRVLDDYGRILSLLVSDVYTKDLNAAAASLGTELDSAIDLYNTKFLVGSGKKLDSSIGGIAAALVRGGGGIWIRHNQTIALRDAVRKAEPVVDEMTTAIEDLAAVFQETTPGKKTIFEEEREQFKDAFLNTLKSAAGRGQIVDLPFTDRVVETLDRARRAGKTAGLAISAARKYRAAHRNLVKAIKDESGLIELSEEIKTLKAEIDAAKKLQKELSK